MRLYPTAQSCPGLAITLNVIGSSILFGVLIMGGGLGTTLLYI